MHDQQLKPDSVGQASSPDAALGPIGRSSSPDADSKPSREELFSVLMREHRRDVLAFVRSCLSNRSDAEDIVQESFTVAWQRFAEYDPERSFAAWLRGIAKLKVLEHLRRSAHAARVRPLTPQQVELVAETFDRLASGRGEAFAHTLAALDDCLRRLSQQDQTVVTGVYRDERPCQIAREMALSLAAVQKRLQRARAWLAGCIERRRAAMEAVYG